MAFLGQCSLLKIETKKSEDMLWRRIKWFIKGYSVINVASIFSFPFLNISMKSLHCEYTSEAPWRGTYNENPQHMLFFFYPKCITKYSPLLSPLKILQYKTVKTVTCTVHICFCQDGAPPLVSAYPNPINRTLRPYSVLIFDWDSYFEQWFWPGSKTGESTSETQEWKGLIPNPKRCAVDHFNVVSILQFLFVCSSCFRHSAGFEFPFLSFNPGLALEGLYSMTVTFSWASPYLNLSRTNK